MTMSQSLTYEPLPAIWPEREGFRAGYASLRSAGQMAARGESNRKGVKGMPEQLRGLILFLLAFLHVPVSGANASSFYVSGANGNDSWSGLLPAPNSAHTDGPFQTLTRAQSALRGSSTIKTATLRAGTYSIAGTGFAWTSSDSGETWIPYVGESVILDGGGTGYLTAERATNLTIEGLTFQNMAGGSGRSGDLLIGGGSGYTIRWNTFLSCQGYCLLAHAIQSSLIDSNTFNRQSPGTIPGTRLPYKVISLVCGSGNRVSHNLIENAEGGGILIGADGSCFSSMSNNVMDRNILKNVNTNDHDMGALYAWDKYGQMSGLQITNNEILGEGNDAIKGIYLDQAITGAVVTGNICNGCGSFAVALNGGANNIVKNNIFDLSSSPTQGTQLGFYVNQGVTSLHMSGNIFSNNIVYSEATFPSAFWGQCCRGNGPQEALNINTNLYCSVNKSSVPSRPPIVDANPKVCCPGFADPANNKYDIPSNSCAFNLIHWQPLPTDQGPLPNPFAAATVP